MFLHADNRPHLPQFPRDKFISILILRFFHKPSETSPCPSNDLAVSLSENKSNYFRKNIKENMKREYYSDSNR